METRVNVGEFQKALNQEPRAYQQHYGEGHLRGHQDALHPLAGGAAQRATAFFQSLTQLRSG